MSTEITTIIVGAICTLVASIITFFLTKRKYNVEVDAQQIENMKSSFELYKSMMEESLNSQKKMMEATISSQNNIINSQNEKIEALQKENEYLKKQVGDLQLQFLEVVKSNYSNRKKK